MFVRATRQVHPYGGYVHDQVTLGHLGGVVEQDQIEIDLSATCTARIAVKSAYLKVERDRAFQDQPVPFRARGTYMAQYIVQSPPSSSPLFF